MTPYYDEDGIRIYVGDCLDVMGRLDERFDLVFTSPPYNLGMGLDDVPAEAMHDRRSGSRKGNAANRLTDGYVDHEDAMPQADYEAWQAECLQAMWGRLTPGGAIFYNHKPRVQAGRTRLPTDLIPTDLRASLRQVVIWDRVEKAQSYTHRAFVASCEWIVVLARGERLFPTRGHSAVSDVWSIHPERGHSDHPCPFPVALPQRAITACEPASVLDPFCGSGSTLVAAKQAGIRGVGIEKSERYAEMAVDRLGKVTRSLFVAPPVQDQGSLL